MNEWVGLGPSAASQHAGWRGANIADLEKWLGNVGGGERMTEDRVAVTPALRAEDALIFGLRMNAGAWMWRSWQARCPDAPWPSKWKHCWRAAPRKELAVRNGSGVRLTDRGRLLKADSVGAEMMEAFEAPLPT